MGYHYIQPDTNPYAGLFSALGIMMANNQNNHEQQARDKAKLDAHNYVQGMQLSDPNSAIGTNYDTIQQLTQNPNVQASEFKNGNIPTDADFLKELTDDYNAKNIDASTKNIQGLVPGWKAYQQADPTQYKADMQAVVDNNGNNNAGLLSGLQGIAQKYGNGGTFGNDVQYLSDQTGDSRIMDIAKTQQQPQLNEKPTVNITPQYIKQQIYSKQGEILQKLHGQGVDLKEAMPMVKQMLDERITDLTAGQADKELQSEYGNVQGVLQADFNNPTARRNAIQAMMQYNKKAHDWGKNTLDVGMIDKLMSTGMVKYSTIKVADPNTGETKIQDILVPINGGTMPDGSAYQTIGEPRSEGISPATIYTQQQQNTRNAASIAAKGNVRNNSGKSTKDPWDAYSRNGKIADQAVMNEYYTRVQNGDIIEPKEQTKYDKASGRLNAYNNDHAGEDTIDNTVKNVDSGNVSDSDPVYQGYIAQGYDSATASELTSQFYAQGG